MLTISAVTLPLGGWKVRADDQPGWMNRSGDLLTLDFFSMPPDIPAPLEDIDVIRAHYRNLLGKGGAIIEIEPERIGDVQALRTLLKIRQAPSGMTYVGAYTLPFRDCSFVVKVQCPEAGITAMRDTVVASKLGLVGAPEWSADPYDPDFRSSTLRNRADDVEWDAAFPDHPLSRARHHLAALRAMRVDPVASSEAPFAGPRRRGWIARLFDKR